VLDANFVPCLGTFQGFPDGDTTVFPNYACASGSPGVLPSQFIFGLTVPRHFVVPNTQQWNLTVQRALGKSWVLEVGYIGTHAVHLRETRTSIRLLSPVRQAVVLSGANCDGSVVGSERLLRGHDQYHPEWTGTLKQYEHQRLQRIPVVRQ
jgi:hypothetical protein